MSDDPNATGSTEPLNDEQGDEGGIPALREAAKRGKEAIARAEAAERQLAIARAGVDISSPLGKMFAKGYDGPMDDVEAIKAAALEVGALGKQVVEPAPSTTPTAVEQQLAAAQQNLGGGTPAAGDTPKPNPHIAAIENYHDQIANHGMSEEDARTDAFALLMSAAAQGDPRAFYDATAHNAAGIAEDRRVSGRNI